MIKVVCIIALAINFEGIPFIVDTAVKGTIPAGNKNDELLPVDFSKSKQAKDPDVLSDLRETMWIDAKKCVRIK